MNSSTLPLDQIAFTKIGNNADKPTIVFLHDSLGSIVLWRDFPQQLGALTDCNVLVYDRQGYGSSCGFTYAGRDNGYMELEAEILNALLNHWHINKAILFGHSDGGSIALIAAAKYPGKMLGVITEGAHIFVEDITVNGISEAIVQYQTTDLKDKLAKYHGDKTDAMFWAWAGTWTKDAFRSWNIEPFLPSVNCPLLVIQGEADQYGTLAQVEGIFSQTNGRAEKFVMPNVKHTPHKECPELVLEKSAAFIKAVL